MSGNRLNFCPATGHPYPETEPDFVLSLVAITTLLFKDFPGKYIFLNCYYNGQ